MATVVRSHAAVIDDVDTSVAVTSERDIARRWVERFALIAFALYHLPLFLNNYPSLGGGGFGEGLAVERGHVFTPVGVWVARHFLGVTNPDPTAYNGDNGDVGEEWGRLLLSIVIAIIGAVWWTIADRKQPRGEWVESAVRVLLRYSIALGLISYGMAKIFPVQFPPLGNLALEERLRDMTPMSMLWRFMSYSRPYNFFAGLMEILTVVLLCFRRTATLGAIVCVMVMTNVALMNYAYNVPVKLYATMIVLSAILLILYDLRRLLAVFVKNEPAPPAQLSHQIQDRIPTPIRRTLKALLVGSVFVSSIIAMAPGARPEQAATAADGIWAVTSFSRGDQVLDSTASGARWRRMIVDGRNFAFRMASDSLINCRGKEPIDLARLVLTCRGKREGELSWTRNGDTLRLEGTFDGAHLTAQGTRVEPRLFTNRFRLISDR
jgi:hypothetical protein